MKEGVFVQLFFAFDYGLLGSDSSGL
jgi:hypothetical protein